MCGEGNNNTVLKLNDYTNKDFDLGYIDQNSATTKAQPERLPGSLKTPNPGGLFWSRMEEEYNVQYALLHREYWTISATSLAATCKEGII